MDDRSHCVFYLRSRMKPRRHSSPRANSLRVAPFTNCSARKNCLNLSWCVFVLVTLAVNVFAQEQSEAATQARAQVLVSEAMRYRLRAGTQEVGQISVNIRNEGDDDFIQIMESASGLIERTTTLLVRKDSTLTPRASHTVMTNASLSQEIQLQYEANKVSGSVLQFDPLGSVQQVSAALSANTQDYYIVPYFLRSCALQVNEVIKFPVYEALRNRVELARGWVAGLEELEAPLGKFVCYRVEGFTGRLRWILYFEKDFPHRLIRQKWPALYLESELVEIKPNANFSARQPGGLF